MSTSYYVHVGPYLRIKKAQIDGGKSINCCSDPLCDKYRVSVYDKSARFCLSCGGEVATKEYPARVNRYNHYDVMGREYEDSFFLPAYCGPSDSGFEYMLPNHHGDRRFSVEPECTQIELDLKKLKPENEIEWFNSKYQEELKLIKAVVGDDMETCWGMITYAH